MPRYCQLPVWKAAKDLALHLKQTVRRFARYHKFTLDGELRLKRAGIAHTLAVQTGFKRWEIMLARYPHRELLSLLHTGGIE